MSAVDARQYAEGNYQGCLAAAALDTSVTTRTGNTEDIVHRLETIRDACNETIDETGLCLLSPIVAGLGIVALRSKFDSTILADEIRSLLQVDYPDQLGSYAVPLQQRAPNMFCAQDAYVETIIGRGHHRALDLHHGQRIKARVHVAKYGEPRRSIAGFLIGMQPKKKNQASNPLDAISRVLCSSLLYDTSKHPYVNRIAPAYLAMWVDDEHLTIEEKIDGVIFSERPIDMFRQPADKALRDMPASIVLHQARVRKVHIVINEQFIKLFTPAQR